MQIRKSYRILAAVLALVMLVGLLPTAVFAKSAGNDGSAEMNEAYAAHESLMPIGPSFNVDTLLEWTPESDPDAVYSRASIPLADRVGGFVVNPLVNPEAKLMLCSLANADHDNTSAQGNESFLSYAFNYWQYTNSFVYWSGSEEGLVCCPTGEFTDAAHTNGVPVVATLGFPWGPGSGYVEQVRKFVQKASDGTFPVADKLIAVMDYYGFDGYFFNQESYGCSAAEGALIDEMMRYMHKQRPDMLISWYDSMLPSGGVSYQDSVNDSNKQFLTDSEDGTRAIDEFMMNYNWTSSKVDTTIATMKSIGRSQFDAFAGIDVQQNCMDTSFRDHLLVDEDGMTRLSLALYCPNSTLGLSKSGENFHEVEQVFYTNAKGDPRDTSVNLSSNDWAGMSRLFADRTVITKAPFVTDFNSGHGKGYYVDGELSRDSEWSYQSNQDVMPTWTWIIDSEGQKLSGGYDFTDAYNGGNSIRFYGNLSAGKANRIMLYSTKVTVESGMKLGLTYKGDQGLMKLVAYYGDETTDTYDACQQVAFDLTAGNGSWTTTEVDLSDLAGKILYAIGLQVESSEDVTDYQVNLGRLTLTEKKRAALNGPADVALDEILYRDAYTAEVRMYWTAVTGAASYEIYQVHPDGSKSLIMETPNTAYYIPTLNRDAAEEDVTLEVLPVNRNGVRGKATTFTIDWAYGNQDSEKIENKYFENVCLNAPVTGVSFENSGEPASKALDGTAANNSKWCASNQSTGWMSIDIGREVTVRRWRVEHAEYGGEDVLMNTVDFALEYRNAAGEWVQVKRIQDNHAAVTDILLDEPVTAQEWKLVIYDDGNSPWGGIRIYEWQMFETAEFPQTTPIPMHFVSAVNGVGATDSVTLEHVTVGDTVKIYTQSAGEFALIGEKVAEDATCVLENLDFGTAEAGRIYYTTTTTAAQESAKLSVPFEAETAEKSEPAMQVSFEKYSHLGSTTSSNGSDIYTTLTVQDLMPGDVVYVYENGVEAGYTKASLPVAQGETSVSIRNIRVTRAGGVLALQVKRGGKLISDVYTVDTPAFAEPTAVIALYARNERGESLTGVRYGVYDENNQKVVDISTTSDSGGKATLPLGRYTLKCEAVPEGYSPNRNPETCTLRIEGWTYSLTVPIADYADPAVSKVTVSPADPVAIPGDAVAFQAAVTGVGAYSEEVTWSVEGAKSQETQITSEGVLTVGANETAAYLTVTATAVQDGATCCKVHVILTSLVNVAGNAQTFAYYNDGASAPADNGPANLVDGDKTTKWQDTVSDKGAFVGVNLGRNYDIRAIKLYHAGSAGEDASLNTADFRFMKDKEGDNWGVDFWLTWENSGEFLSQHGYAETIASYTGNTEDVTTYVPTQPLETDAVMLKVEKANATADDNLLRLYELEVLVTNEDQVAARRVMVLIDAIGEVTEESRPAIAAAREQYDALTEAQKALVENYQTLLDAEKALDNSAVLQEYYDALIAANRYSADGKKALTDLLAQGLAALEGCSWDEAAAILEQYQAAMDAVPTYEEELIAAKEAAEAAQRAAEEAQEQAEEAQKAAEAAKKAAEEAAASTAEDKAAAQAAQAAAEAAQAKAETAKAAAEAAKQAAEAAAEAAESSNQAAAAEAAKAAEEALKAAREASNAAQSAEAAAEAQRAAQAAQAKAEEAQAKAEEARQAAEEAAASAAEDKTAAEAARVKAEEAQAQAEAAQAAAETAKTAAEAASAAAEQFQLAAAEEARKSAEEAAKSAASAAAAAESAAQAADAMVKARAAQAAAEAAAKTAQEAQKKAEEAQRKAEEAAASTAEDKEAAEKAAQEAKAAQAAAEAAQKSAEEAQVAAETARAAAEASNQAAAASAALAAEYAQKVTETYAEIVEIKAQMVEFLAKAQQAAEEAEAERKAAEEAQKKAEEAALAAAKYYALMELAQVDTTGCNDEQKQAVEAALTEAREAIEAAETREEVGALLIEAREAVEQAMHLVCASDLFQDVARGAWYHDGVDYMVRRGYMEGVGNNLFAVNGTMTRGQMVTILYRIAGKPTVEGLENPFKDVADGKFYTDAVIWAAENGIVEGNGDGTFNPNGFITRQQVAVILYRYSGEEAVSEDMLSSYPDGSKVANYAREAMNWAVAKGLIQGVANGETATLNPAATATRGQMATIFMRDLER